MRSLHYDIHCKIITRNNFIPKLIIIVFYVTTQKKEMSRMLRNSQHYQSYTYIALYNVPITTWLVEFFAIKHDISEKFCSFNN